MNIPVYFVKLLFILVCEQAGGTSSSSCRIIIIPMILLHPTSLLCSSRVVVQIGSADFLVGASTELIRITRGDFAARTCSEAFFFQTRNRFQTTSRHRRHIGVGGWRSLCTKAWLAYTSRQTGGMTRPGKHA